MLEAALTRELIIGAAVALTSAGAMRLLRGSLARRFGGAIAVVAASVSLAATGSLPLQVLASLFGLLVGGWLWKRNRLIAAVIVLASALPIVGASPMSERYLFLLSTALYVLCGGWAIDHFETRRGPIVPALFAVTVLGAYLTVPSPNEVSAVLGAATAVAILPRLSHTSSFAIMGLLLWTVVLGGSDRTGSIVGALAGIGILVMEPVGRALGTRIPRSLRLLTADQLTPRLLLAIQLVVVTVTSRVAGFRLESEPAFALALLAWILGWSLMAFDLERNSDESSGASEDVLSVDEDD